MRDECYSTDGTAQGRCDTCGARTATDGCTADPSHDVAVDAPLTAGTVQAAYKLADLTGTDRNQRS